MAGGGGGHGEREHRVPHRRVCVPPFMEAVLLFTDAVLLFMAVVLLSMDAVLLYMYGGSTAIDGCSADFFL